jgi:hypothetical protein
MDTPHSMQSAATGRLWTVQTLTAAQSRAYARKGQPAPRYAAHAPAGSIIRRATLEQLAAAVDGSTAP